MTPRAPGDAGNAASFSYPVRYEVVQGGLADLVDQIDSLRYIRPDIRVAGVLVNQWHRSPVVEDAAA